MLPKKKKILNLLHPLLYSSPNFVSQSVLLSLSMHYKTIFYILFFEESNKLKYRYFCSIMRINRRVTIRISNVIKIAGPVLGFWSLWTKLNVFVKDHETLDLICSVHRSWSSEEFKYTDFINYNLHIIWNLSLFILCSVGNIYFENTLKL